MDEKIRKYLAVKEFKKSKLLKKAERQRIDVFELWCSMEKTLESPLDCKEIQPVHSEGDQPWVFFARNNAKAETPVLWPPHEKSWLFGKDSNAGRDWGQEEKGTTEDEMAGWYHRLDGHVFEWTPGDGDGQGGLACCHSWGHKESDTAERLIWADPFFSFMVITDFSVLESLSLLSTLENILLCFLLKTVIHLELICPHAVLLTFNH